MSSRTPALPFEPENELGVVYLFGLVARRLGFHVEDISASYPDCLATLGNGGQKHKVRIEFEFKSSSFRAHRHDPKKCDVVVCWTHNWPELPRRIQVIELSKIFGVGRSVWIASYAAKNDDDLAHTTVANWSVPRPARPGDLVLFYLTRPVGGIKYAFEIRTDPTVARAGYREGTDVFAKMRKVAAFKCPLTLEAMRESRALRSAHFVRQSFQSRTIVNAHWPALHAALIERNPAAERSLRKFAPETFVV